MRQRAQGVSGGAAGGGTREDCTSIVVQVSFASRLLPPHSGDAWDWLAGCCSIRC